MTLHGYEAIIQRITGICSAHLRLDIHADHLGSFRMLTTSQKNLHGSKVIQYIEYDSFGNPIACSNPEFRSPLGFAGGLNDPFTGFVRFGYRDYDPRVGRFTTKDPLGDTGGDHDLWDYCVDDPVSMNDPEGLEEESVCSPFWENILPKPYCLRGERLAEWKKGFNLDMQEYVYNGLGKGLRTIVLTEQKIPGPLSWIGVAPKAEHFEQSDRADKNYVESLQKRKDEFKRSRKFQD